MYKVLSQEGKTGSSFLPWPFVSILRRALPIVSDTDCLPVGPSNLLIRALHHRQQPYQTEQDLLEPREVVH
jgi:hypothetical protein